MTTRVETRATTTEPRASRPELLLGSGLAVVSAAAAVGTLLPGTLEGPAAMNGSARGTALVVLVVALPLLLVSAGFAHRGSQRGRAVWVGTTAYLTYNAVLFCFATPFNRLYLLYVAMLGLAFWSLVLLVAGTRTAGIDGSRVPARGLAAYLWVVAALNAAAWLASDVPGLVGDLPPDSLDGTGLTTNPIHVQDLALWLPAMAVVGWGLWRRRGWGVFLGSAGLVFWLVEAVGVAVDQWWGHRVDPDSEVVSLAGSVGFVVLAAITLVPLALSFRWTPHPRPD
jgi:hypothetical protein